MDLYPDLGLDIDLDLNRELTRRTVAVDAAAVVGVSILLPTAGTVAAVHDAPRVAGADGAFGEVAAETATVETDGETERVAPAFRSTDRAVKTGLPADEGD